MAMAYGLVALKFEIEQEDCGPVGPEPKTREKLEKSSQFSLQQWLFVRVSI